MKTMMILLIMTMMMLPPPTPAVCSRAFFSQNSPTGSVTFFTKYFTVAFALFFHSQKTALEVIEFCKGSTQERKGWVLVFLISGVGYLSNCYNNDHGVFQECVVDKKPKRFYNTLTLMRFAMIGLNHNPMEHTMLEWEIINICICIFFKLAQLKKCIGAIQVTICDTNYIMKLIMEAKNSVSTKKKYVL